MRPVAHLRVIHSPNVVHVGIRRSFAAQFIQVLLCLVEFALAKCFEGLAEFLLRVRRQNRSAGVLRSHAGVRLGPHRGIYLDTFALYGEFDLLGIFLISRRNYLQGVAPLGNTFKVNLPTLHLPDSDRSARKRK